jgi:hypothetical protein
MSMFERIELLIKERGISHGNICFLQYEYNKKLA